MHQNTLYLIFATAFITLLASGVGMVFIMKDVPGGTRTMPDAHFGFTPDALRHVCAVTWGAAGRQAYVQAANVDLFPFMQAYTVIFWCAATVLTRQGQGFWKGVGYTLGTLPLVFDTLETRNLRDIVQRDCQVSNDWMEFTSLMNQIKWSCVLLFWVILVPPFWLASRRRHKEEGATKTE